MKRSSFVLFAIVLVLFSCDSEKEIEDGKTIKTDSTQVEVVKEESVLEEFNGDTLFIPQKFTTELDSAEYALLERLDLCTGRLENDTLDAMNPPCNGRLFRFYQLNDQLSKNELFLIEMKKGLYGNLDNKIVILAKIADEYITLSSMVGYLLEMRNTATGYKELLVLHPNRSSRTDFGMKYAWDADARKYEPVLLELVDYAPVKPSVQDSVTQEAIKELKEQNVIFEI